MVYVQSPFGDAQKVYYFRAWRWRRPERGACAGSGLTQEVCSQTPLDLSTTPLSNPDLIYYADGSARWVDGVETVGFAIVSDHDMVKSARLPAHLSALAAELFALTRACILAAGKICHYLH